MSELKSINENEKEAEKLINELEKIYLCGGWRGDEIKFNREKQIKVRLSELLCKKLPL